MSGRKRAVGRQFFLLGSVAVLLAAVVALFMRGRIETGDDRSLPTEPPKSGLLEFFTYCVGYGLAMLLTIAAFSLVHWHWAPPMTTLGIIFGLALAQIIIHFRCFLHVTLQGAARDDLQLILFSTLIVFLMVGGTLIVLFNLRMRMM